MINHGARNEFEFSGKLIEETLTEKIEKDNEKAFLENLAFSYECLMSRMAEPIVKRLANKVKKKLQSYGRDTNMMLTEEDSGLRNLWDELCVQVQGEESIFYELYLFEIKRLISDMLSECSEDEIIILWTQTREYEEWRYLCEDCEYTDVLKVNCNNNDVCEYVLSAVISLAGDFTSKRIDEYLYRGE